MERAYDEAEQFLEKYGHLIFAEHKDIIKDILQFLKPYRSDLYFLEHWGFCAYSMTQKIRNEYNICMCFFIDKKLIQLRMILDKYQNLIELRD